MFVLNIYCLFLKIIKYCFRFKKQEKNLNILFIIKEIDNEVKVQKVIDIRDVKRMYISLIVFLLELNLDFNKKRQIERLFKK